MVDLDTGERHSRRLWIFAGLTALALHLGGAALAVAHLRADTGDTGLGANADEIAVELASPKVDDDDLPPGPDSDPMQASRQVAEQKAEVKETDLPKDRPNETEEPDRIVTQSNTKPKEDEQKTAAVETPAAIEQEAQQATSRKTLDDDAPEAEKAKAPIIGIGKDQEKLTRNWEAKLSGYIQSHLRYPKVPTSKTVVVEVKLVLNRLGRVVSVDVLQSSGDPVFDEAAISTIRRSDPLPAPPASLTDEQFIRSLAMRFKAPKR